MSKTISIILSWIIGKEYLLTLKEVKDIFSDYDFSKNRRDLERYKKTAFPLAKSIKNSGGNNQVIEISSYDKDIFIESGNRRIWTILNNPIKLGDESIDLSDCKFRLIYNGERERKQIERSIANQELQVGLTVNEKYRSIKKMVQDLKMSETDIKNHFGKSRGYSMNEFRVAKMAINFPDIEIIFLNGKLKTDKNKEFNVDSLHGLYTIYRKSVSAKNKTDIARLTEKINDYVNTCGKTEDNKVIRSVNRDRLINEYIPTLPIELSPLIEKIAGDDEAIIPVFNEFKIVAILKDKYPKIYKDILTFIEKEKTEKPEIEKLEIEKPEIEKPEIETNN